jgi:hypothetical protein
MKDAPLPSFLATLRTLLEPIHADLHPRPREGALPRLADILYRARRARGDYFHSAMGGEPNDQILLVLFLADARGARLSVSAISRASGVALSSGHRMILRLEDHGLVIRTRDTADHRRMLVSLSEPGRAAMIGYLASLHAALTDMSH